MKVFRGFGFGIDEVVDLSVGAKVAVSVESGNPREDDRVGRSQFRNVDRVKTEVEEREGRKVRTED